MHSSFSHGSRLYAAWVLTLTPNGDMKYYYIYIVYDIYL